MGHALANFTDTGEVEIIEEPLNDRQAAFCREYLKDYNGTQAAIRATYSPNGAEVTASKLLRLTKIKHRILKLTKEKQQLEQKVVQEVVVDAAWVLEKSRQLHEHCTQEFVPVYDKYGRPKLCKETGNQLYMYKGQNISGAAKSLELVGKNKLVKAFDTTQEHHLSGELAAFFGMIQPTLGPPDER